ncbi:hypothetical protein SAY86_022022 [Trapa natans]|uniref:Transcriptional corepressor SEUSS n=1 Tax=Trapa natans TaxID=22666 RepID=A0AAN7MTB5_TRANT|nr:hypothetical protein SAY86_022022 [Trapa natans]
MVLSGPPAPVGGAQSVPSSLLRSTSGLMGAQGGSTSNQNAFSSLVSRGQFNNMNILGNALNMSSQLSQSFGNGSQISLLPGSVSSQRALIDTGAESNSLLGVGNGVGFSSPSPSLVSSNPGVSGQFHGQQFPTPSGTQLRSDSSHPQQFEPQNFQNGLQTVQQFSASNGSYHQQSQQQFQSIRGLAAVGHVKLEPQTANDQLGEEQHLSQQQQQQLQSLQNIGPVKLESQQMRSLAPVKLETNHSELSLSLQQQQQQQPQQQHQQLLQMARQPPQAGEAHINMLPHQQLSHLRQQQLMKAIQSQRGQFSPQIQQQNLPLRSPVKPAYEPGTCARRLTHYMYQQQHRPEDNNIEFWRKFVSQYFAPNAKKKWCVSMYGSGRQTTGVFPQDVWHCEICKQKPGRGFEATFEVLPRLFKIKYESGTLEELLYVDMPHEYQNSSGQIVLDYAKAIQESVFEQLRVVRDGQLRVVFSLDLKICSWEFCARHHEELIPRRLLIPQVNQLGAAAQKYQAASQNAPSNLSVPELQNNCNMFLTSARQLAKALEVPLVNELGYTKRYVRCLQISEVVNCMKDLIDYSKETGSGPMESLVNFPRSNSSGSSVFQNKPQQLDNQQQPTILSTSTATGTDQGTAMQVDTSNSIAGEDNPINKGSTSASSGTIVGLIHQNSMNSRQQCQVGNAASPYGAASGVQIASPGSSTTTIPQNQPGPSPFQSTPSSSGNPTPSSAGHMNSVTSPANMPLRRQGISSEADQNETQSSVQKILQGMMCSRISGSGATLGNELEHVNGITPGNISTGIYGPTIHNPGGFGSMNGQPTLVNGFRNVNGNPLMNGRVGMGSMVQGQGMARQSDMNNQILNGLRAANGFNNLQFDWKPSS